MKSETKLAKSRAQMAALHAKRKAAMREYISPIDAEIEALGTQQNAWWRDVLDEYGGGGPAQAVLREAEALEKAAE